MAETSNRVETRAMKRALDTRIETRAMKRAKDNKGGATSVGTKPSRSVKPRKKRKPIVKVTVTETKEEKRSDVSESVMDMDKFFCQICVEKKIVNEAFKIKGCTHSFCSECMSRYVASKIQENVLSIGCPEMNCEGVLEPELCQSILPLEVFDRWGTALCEALILEPQKIYCPYKDCSALLIDECGDECGGGRSQSECPHCKRLFCVQCKVPWHAEIICEEFQKLSADEREREDILLVKAVKENKWNRCPGCKFYVERDGGCPRIDCRCGHAFCYYCGYPMEDHYCDVCRR